MEGKCEDEKIKSSSNEECVDVWIYCKCVSIYVRVCVCIYVCVCVYVYVGHRDERRSEERPR